ncbi:MAG: hypothetical protein ACHBN1_24145 [Heteroscytonema crispum UTEX LB 1556]
MKIKYLGLGLAATMSVFTSGFTFAKPSYSQAANYLQTNPVKLEQLTAQNTPENIQKRPEAVPIQLDQAFQLRINQKAILASDNIKIKFLKVTQDSRCPANVACIWAGQVEIVVEIWEKGQNLGEFTLTSRPGSPDLAIKSFGNNFTIKFVGIEPSLSSQQEIKKSDYIAQLVVSKNGEQNSVGQ